MRLARRIGRGESTVGSPVPGRNRKPWTPRVWWVPGLLAAMWMMVASVAAETRQFLIEGSPKSLDRSQEPGQVEFRALRPSRVVPDSWTVDVVVRNRGKTPLLPPLVLSFDQQVNVSRDQGITGVNSGGVTFINLSSKLSANGLAPGAELPPFTITMPRGSGVPSVAGALYAKSVELFGPVAVAQSVTTDEDAAVSLVLSGTDADGDALTFTVVTSPSRGVLTGTAPNLTYTPNPNAHGTDRFTFKVNDGRTDSSVAAVTVLVRPVNDVPVAAAQTVAVASGAARSITLAGSDVDGDALSFAVVTPPTQGVLSGTAPNLTYTANPNATGADNFTFKVNDGRVDSLVATVVIEFGAGNRPPVAIAQTVTADEDIPKAITLAGSDADGNALTHIVVSPPNRGTLSGTAPNLTYTPNPNAHGADSFTFKVNDGTVDSPVTTVSITVRPVNDVPGAAAQTVAVASGAARSITLAGSDVDGDALSFAVVTPPTQGVLSGTAPNLTYTPNPNATGADNFTFKVNDGRVDSPVATVVIEFGAGNRPPVAIAQTVTADEDIPKSITLAGSDADGNAMTHIVVSPPNRGTLSGTAPNLTYTPNPNAHGVDSFTFKVNDGTVDSPVTTVSITVRPVNDVPVAAAQTVAVASGAARSITLTGSDVDGDALSFAVVTPPTQGVLSGTVPNLTYTPNSNATGADSFTFKVNDGRVDSPVATVVIDLRAVADPPSALTWTGRVVDEDGIPLDAAEVQAIGSEEASSTPVRRGGWFSVPVETGIRGWRISAPGRHASFRARSAVMPDVPDAVVLASSNHVAAPAAFELPSPLPAGWTPLVAGRFPAGRFELGSQTNGPVSEGAAVVAWDEDRLAWRLLDSTDREAVYRGELAAAAVVARIRPDVGLVGTGGAVGTFLDGPVAGVGTGTVTATGRLEPPNRIASTNRSEVLTRGFVEFRSTAGPLPSGTAFRCEVRESYELRDGSRRVLPAYTMLIRAYRVAGADAALLRAEFPLRPTQLLSSERLAEARVEVDVLDRSDERLRPIPAGGTVLQSGLFRLGIPAGMFPAGGQARLTELQASPFDLTLPAGVAGVAAFDLDLPAGAPGGTGVSTEFLGQTPGTRRVLARVVFDADEAGFQPLLRLRAGTDGVAVSEEPAMGGLRGMDGGGRHVVFQLVVAQPQVVVRGTARNVAGVAVAGMVVRSGPWTALTDADGRYELLVPAATATASLTVTDRSTGDVAQVPVPATAEGGVATVDVDLSPRGPFLVASNPVAGATAVARVSPVVLTFSRPLNPGTVVVPGAVVLAGTNGVVLPAAVSINPAGDTVTLLPTAQLPASAPLRVVLSTNLQDRLGRTLEGAREITFTTLGDTLRRADAVLTIFEPVNGLAGMSGGPGLADPESAVILINQTTGETATVLSKPDGSFTNRIAATADDELAAILVNRNGTQTTVPAARQEFRDGSVGLFGGGGVIRRTFGSGEMELEVPPGAISGKTVFRIQERSVAEVTGALGSLLPTDQRLLGGFRFAIGGDPLRKAPRIRLPIPAGMKDEFGAGLTNREFLIVRRRVDEDGAFLEPVDVAKVVGDRLENRGVGVPFIPLGEAVGDTDLSSLFAIRLPAVKSRRALSSVAKGIGNVYGRGVGFEDECGLLMPIRRVRLTPIRGSVFSTVAAVRGSERRPVTRARILGDGMSSVMATSPDSRGAFSTFVETDGDTVGARATSPDFPGQSAVGVALVARGDDGDSVAGAITLMFDRGEESLIDREDPRVSVSHSPGEPTVGNAVTVRVQGNDDQRVASVELVVEQVLPLFSLQPVSVSDIRLTAGAQVRIARGSLRQSFTLDTSKPARIRLRATVRDSASKRATTVHTVVVGASSVPRTGDDLTGPSVVSSSPFPGEDSFQPGRRIRLTFSEPVTGIPDNLTAGDLFQLSPFSGVPTVEFAADRKSVELTWYELIPDRDYTLTVNPLLRDEAGNLFDQNPSNNPPPTDPPTANPAADPFQLPFRTSPQVPVALRGVRNGAGVAVLGNRLLVLDRSQAANGAGSLHVYDPTLPDAPLQTVGVRLYPRSLQVLRSQTYPASSRAPGGTDDLVLVCGGQVNQSEPWMMVFAFKPDGSIVELLRQDVASQRDTSRSAFKVLASPPLAACLLIGGSTEVVAFDLFDAIREQRIFDRLPGSSGVVGIPLGGRHVMTEDSEGSRVRDFDIGMAGDRIALVGSPNRATPPPAFETVIEEFGHSDPVPVDRESKRVFLALDQPVRTAQGEETHDFAILSQFPTATDPNGRLLVLNLDDPERPVVANEISVPIRHGTPQRIQRREDGLLSLAGTEDVLLLDPTRLLSPTPTDNGAHPALVGRFIGMGTLMPEFVSTSDGMVARAQGERTEVMGSNIRFDMAMHRPGSIRKPGPIVPENAEDALDRYVVFANSDQDCDLVSQNQIGPPDWTIQDRKRFQRKIVTIPEIEKWLVSLRFPSAVSRHIQGLLSEDARQRLLDWDLNPDPEDPDFNALVKAVNDSIVSIIRNSDLFSPTAFSRIQLREEASELISQRASAPLRERLNRILLEDSYPSAFERTLRFDESDNDIIRLEFSRVPFFVKGEKVFKLRLRTESESGGAPLQLLDSEGKVVGGSGSQNGAVLIEERFDGAGSVFGPLQEGPITLHVEATNSVKNARLIFEALDESDEVLVSDTVVFSAVLVEVTSIWSEQFGAQRISSNYLPGNAGGERFIFMGNDASGVTRAGASVAIQPSTVKAEDHLMARFYVPSENRVVGSSQWRENNVSVSARDDRAIRLGLAHITPLLFSSWMANRIDTEEFLMIGIDYNGNGELEIEELASGWQTRSAQLRPRLNESANRELHGFDQPHFKVIPKELWDSQTTPLAIGALVLLDEFADLGRFAQLNLLGPESILPEEAGGNFRVAAVMMHRFMTGRSPSGSILAPDFESTYRIPDRLNHRAGLVKLDHQTGPFGQDGFLEVPRLHYRSNHTISESLRQSIELNRLIRANAVSNTVVLQAYRSQTTAQGSFLVEVDLKFDETTTTEDRRLLSGSFAGKDPDLYYAFGGCILPSLRMTIQGQRNGNRLSISGIRYSVVVQDLYDWFWEVNPFGVILQSGFNTYGSQSGGVFVNEAIVEGQISELLEAVIP
jgi:hypothetical protein